MIGMDPIATMKSIRLSNLRRLIDEHYRGNKSAIARDYCPEDPKPSYFNDLLREGSGKSFGEKAARKIEAAVGLLPGQLDVENSTLRFDVSRSDRLDAQLRAAIDRLDVAGKREALAYVRTLVGR